MNLTNRLLGHTGLPLIKTPLLNERLDGLAAKNSPQRLWIVSEGSSRLSATTTLH
jgi:hypothetical protein